MTIAQLIKSLVDVVDGNPLTMNSEVVVRVVTRNRIGAVVAAKHAPLEYMGGHYRMGKICLCVTDEELKFDPVHEALGG